MSDRIEITYCADTIATALHAALRSKRIPKIGIDEVISAAISYRAAGAYFLSEADTERLIEAVLRKVVEKVG